MEAVRVIFQGVGQVGTMLARSVLKKQGVEIVGAVDTDPAKVGRDLGEVLGVEKRLGVAIVAEPEALFSRVKAHVLLLTTGSYLKEVRSQIELAVRHRLNVLSTCEELAFPYVCEPELAWEIDGLAKEHGVSVLGTGINPGFMMDTLPIVLTGVTQEIKSIKVSRVMNAATRRPAFQRKIGAGLTPDQFQEQINSKVITGHVGLEQSIAQIASALGWELEEIKVETPRPVVAPQPVASPAVRVEGGQVAGSKQLARGIKGGQEVITLEFQAYLGAPEEYDAVSIDGVPPINQKISPCVHGDAGTVAIVVNSIPRVIHGPPGLIAMKDLPLPCAAQENMALYVATTAQK